MMDVYTLSTAELTVLLDHMAGGRLLEGAASFPDLEVDEAALRAAEESLLERGLLLSLPFEEVAGVTSQLASVLSTALTPDRVCIVRTIHQDHTDPPVIFSFTPECISRNYVDKEGMHVFARLADQDEAVSAILADTGDVSAKKGSARPRARPLADLVKAAHRLVMMLVVADPTEAEAEARCLSWLESNESLWLVDEASQEDAPLAIPVVLKDLRLRITAELARQG
jgi:hypothetical protein